MATLDALLASGEGSRFDLAFIDADKANYQAYYERALALVRPGGLIIVDNVLWGGSVINPEKQDADTLAIRAFNTRIRDDDRVDLSLVPIGDGLALAMKRG
jgi:caffeoyl-CoA O-methyltransferase